MTFFFEDAIPFIYLCLSVTVFLGILGVSLIRKGRRSGIGFVLLALLCDVAGTVAAVFDCSPWNWHVCR